MKRNKPRYTKEDAWLVKTSWDFADQLDQALGSVDAAALLVSALAWQSRHFTDKGWNEGLRLLRSLRKDLKHDPPPGEGA